MEFKVFGCKTNKYFTEKWLVHPHLADKEGYFIASCVVTDKAKAKWVKHAKRILPGIKTTEKLYLSGCGNIRDGVVDPRFYEVYSELAPYRDQIEVLPEDPDDYSVTPEEKKEMMKTKIRSLRKIAGRELFTRKYMVIQTGCDNFCTFCLTVQARGRHKYRAMEEILEEIRDFVVGGGKEVVFTGINLGAWGATTSNNYSESRLIELIQAVLEKTTLERLRISSLGVEFCSDELIQFFAEPRIVAYAHLSIQSGSTSILKAMNRHYDGERVREVLAKLRQIKRSDGMSLNIGADLIVGFPGESDADFRDTLECVERYQISQLHAFPFSAHVDHYSVPAGVYPDQVPNHIAQSRIKSLQRAGAQVFTKWAEKTVGSKVRVLVEKVTSKKEQKSEMGVRGEGTVQNFQQKISSDDEYQILMSEANTERAPLREALEVPLGYGLPLETFDTFDHKSMETGVFGFSGWTENYLACDETNFEPYPDQEIARGKVVKGIYRAILDKTPSE